VWGLDKVLRGFMRYCRLIKGKEARSKIFFERK